MILPLIGPLTFLNPWILAGLAFLPVLWFLLRVTPPAPRRHVFPAARFLAGLIPEEQTASSTPWWILLMRLLAAALIIIALSRPVLNPGESLSGHGPVRLVIDNGWAAARNWRQTMQTAEDLADHAAREGRAVYLLTTAPEPGSAKPMMAGPLTKGEAEAALRGLTPRPWPADYTAAGDTLDDKDRPIQPMRSFWLSHGMRDEGGFERLMNLLRTQGGLDVYRPDPAHYPLMVRPVTNPGTDIEAFVDAAPGIANGTPVSLEAQGLNGQVIDVQQVKLDATNLPQKVTFTMPESLRGQVSRITLSGQPGAGGVLLFDNQLGRKTVGIVSTIREGQQAPLIEASFYLQRALSPYADLHTGPISDLLKLKPAAIILPDIGAMAPQDLNVLQDWVKQGGLLLRFAGPNMSQGENFLTPVPLLKGGRAMSGAMAWQKPLHIAPFPQTSPFYGLEVPPDVTIKQQILAEPTDNMDKKTWGALEDGTPLITADSLGRGMLVLVHTTATPAWSDLALSGLFVQLLRRTINMAGTGASPSEISGGALQPLSVLDGFGAMTSPDSTVEPILADKADSQKIDSRHPPGIYGRTGVSHPLNLGEQVPYLKAFGDLPVGVGDLTYGKMHEQELMPGFLAAALLLFFADWLAMIVLQAGWRIRSIRAAAILLTTLALSPLPAHAQDSDADAVKYAGNIYLAYVRSGDASVDTTTQAGLEALAQVLNERTSVEPAGVVALDPEHDDLSFFPLIYWPVTDAAQPLSANALSRVQFYLDHGGTIMFDTADQAQASGGRNTAALQRIASGLNIPPLIAMPDSHVLTRSFYLLRSVPGRYDGGVIWVEDQSASGRDGVSSVIVGGNDWAYAWASAGGQGPQLAGGERQGELAIRFGVNLMMYALTGNYKSDQVHLKQIMERLGQ